MLKSVRSTWCLLSVREYQQLNREIMKLHKKKSKTKSLERMQKEMEETILP